MANKKRSARSFKCIPSTWAAPEVWSKSNRCAESKKDSSGRCRRPAKANDATGGAGFRCYDMKKKRITKQKHCSARCVPSVATTYDAKKGYKLAKTWKRAPRA